MEHILNRRTTTILTYINQGRRPAAFPVFPARPPRRRARMAPFPAACPGAAGRPAGAPPVPMGIRRLAPGPVVMAPPDPPHARGPRPRSSNPDPPGPAIGTRSSGYERIRGGKGGGRGRNGWTPERIRTGVYEWTKTNGEGGTPVSRTVAPARGGGKRGTPREPEGARPGGTVSCEAAARYSPTPSRVQYHRRAGP